jgi:hypothetical protein
MRRPPTLLLAGVAAATTASLAMPATAHAATPTAVSAAPVASCVVPANYFRCVTGAVSAGSDGVIDFNVNTGWPVCTYVIKDVVTGRTVREGSTVGSTFGRVTGLTNSYQLILQFCVPGSSGAIW